MLAGLLAPCWGTARVDAATPTGPGRPCADPLLARPQPASDAMARLSATQQRRAAALNDLSVDALRHVASAGPTGDETFWLDRCGRGLYLDPAVPDADRIPASLTAPAQATSAEGGPAAPLADTFTLQSNPSSTHTIYLDFDGQTVTGSAWNSPDYGPGTSPSITAAPYSLDSKVDTDFSASELTQIQRAWMVVAEDYAPYDVNVTTRDPGSAALQRSGPADTQYGVRVVITAHGPIYDYCRCGGIAYVGIYGDPSANAYQPAWVFTDATTTDGVILAQAVSHEVGHTLGLRHDGTTSTSGDNYYAGSGVWAPIMGVSYYAPLTQWSKGEYPLANNQEDDTATIGTVLGVRRDDHADGLTGAEALPAGVASQRAGIIGTRADVDAFTLTTGDQALISAHPTGYQPDLDLSLTITEAATGRLVARIDPPSARGSGVAADGLGADYRLPAGPTTTYLIAVDGVGNGDPSTAGHYSDYASQGAYLLTVVPGDSQPLGVQRSSATVEGRVGQTWDAVSGTAFAATGGVAPYSWSGDGLPPGATLDAVTATVHGRIGTTGQWFGSATVTDATGATATIAATFRALPAAAVLVSRTVTGVAGRVTHVALRAGGGDGHYAWALDRAVSGARLTPEGLLTVGARPKGTLDLIVALTSAGLRTTGVVRVVVLPPAPAWRQVAVRHARIGRAYRGTLTVTGGDGALRWRVAGALPPGIRLKVRNAGRKLVLAGTGQRTGRWRVTLHGMDRAGRELTRTMRIAVRR